MRIARFALAAIVVATAAGPAGAGDLDGGSLVGLGFSPSVSVDGALAEHFGSGGGGGRLRLGARFGRLGVELTMAVAGLTDVATRAPGATVAGAPSSVLFTPMIALYAIKTPPLQLSMRGGLGFGTIEGLERHESVRCGEGEGCFVRDEVTPISYPGFGLDVGATAHLHLARRRGQRLVLWVDAGVQLLRFRIDDANVGGRIHQLTVGLAHGHEF